MPGQAGFHPGIDLDRHAGGGRRLFDAQRYLAQQGLQQIVGDQQAYQEAQTAGLFLGTQRFERHSIGKIGIVPQQFFDQQVIAVRSTRQVRHQGRETRGRDVCGIPADGTGQHMQ